MHVSVGQIAFLSIVFYATADQTDVLSLSAGVPAEGIQNDFLQRIPSFTENVVF